MSDTISSEAIKQGMAPSKPISQMSSYELKEFRNSFDPDSMGFDGREGVNNDN